ncbi:MAG TPA: EamA family transporter [Dongiaceae bacterium]
MQSIAIYTEQPGEGAATRILASGGFAATFGRLPPTALMLLSIFSSQLGAALATVFFSSIGPVGTSFASTLCSALVLTAMARPRISNLRLDRPLIDRRLRRHFGWLFLLGLVELGMGLPFYLAIERIPLGIAATISFFGPLGLAVATSRRPLHFALIGLGVLGIALLAPEVGGALDPVGLAYAGISAVAWAAFVPISKRLGRVFSGTEALAYALWVTTALLLIPALWEGNLRNAGMSDLAGTFGVSLLGVVLPMALEYRALQRMSARTYGILLTLEPGAGALVGVVCLGQQPSGWMLVAVACVMLSALGITLSDRADSRRD